MNKLSDLTDKQWTIGIFLLSLGLYSITLAPTVIWGDSANFALMVHQFLLDPAADGHPFYIILGKVFSWLPGELAVNLNFMSAFFAAITVTLVYLITTQITQDKLAGALGALALSVSHSFWLNAVISEVYTLNACFLLTVAYLMLKWKDERHNSLLYWAAFAFGLALSNHLVIGLIGISILYFLFVYDRNIFKDKRILIILACFFLGLSVYLGVLLHWLATLPEKSAEITDIATGRGHHKQYMFYFDSTISNIKMYIAYLAYQFPFIGGLVGLAGLIKFFRDNKKLAWFFILAIAANAGFFIVGPKTFGGSNYTFYIQDYAIFSIFIAYGCHCLIKNGRKNIVLLLFLSLLLTPIFTYQLVPIAIKNLGIDLLKARSLPYRDNEQFFLNPSKFNYHGPDLYARAVFRQLEPNATIIADYTPAAVLDYYQQVLGVRPDVNMIYVQDASKAKQRYDLKPYVDENYERGPIYLADLAGRNYYNVKNLEKEYQIVPVKPIYRVIKK